MAAAAKRRATNPKKGGIFWNNSVSGEEKPLAFVPGVSPFPRCSSRRGRGGAESGMKSTRRREEEEEEEPVTMATSVSLPPLQVCLKDLCPEDKKRIANLVQELARVSEEKEESTQRLLVEQSQFEQKILELEEQNVLIAHERESLQQQYRECQELLALYQLYLQQQQQTMELPSTQQQALTAPLAPPLSAPPPSVSLMMDGSYLGLAQTQTHRAEQLHPQSSAPPPRLCQSSAPPPPPPCLCRSSQRPGPPHSGASSLRSESTSGEQSGSSCKAQNHTSPTSPTSPVDRRDTGRQKKTSSTSPVDRTDTGRQKKTSADDHTHTGRQKKTSSTSPVDRRDTGRQKKTSPVDRTDTGRQKRTSSTSPVDRTEAQRQKKTSPSGVEPDPEDWEQMKAVLLLQKKQLEEERARLQRRLTEQEERRNQRNVLYEDRELGLTAERDDTKPGLSSRAESPPRISSSELTNKRDAGTSPSAEHLLHQREEAPPPQEDSSRLEVSVSELLQLFSPLCLGKQRRQRSALAPPTCSGPAPLDTGHAPLDTGHAPLDWEESQILEEIFFIC